MRKILFGLLAFLLITSFSLASVPSVEALQGVKGYTKKNGSYVAPHYKTSPNKSKLDNFSSKGNINPFSGKMGTVNPFKTTPKKFR